jgi:predicted amidophosphoribosyltransferase
MEETLALQEMRCPVCRAQVDPSFLVCPVCTTRLRQSCDSCKAPLEPLWQICPYCETPIESPRALDLDAPQSLESERGRRGERASG